MSNEDMGTMGVQHDLADSAVHVAVVDLIFDVAREAYGEPNSDRHQRAKAIIARIINGEVQLATSLGIVRGIDIATSIRPAHSTVNVSR